MENNCSDPARIADALIIVDVQVAFVEGPNAVPESSRVISTVGHLLASARSANAPIIFLQNDGPKGAADEPLRPGWELYFTPQPTEAVVRKTKDDGFDGTSLDSLLKSMGIQTLAFCGLASEMCVAATARGAMHHGYRVLLPHDAHATYDVPAGPGSQPVPASMASRVAEWSLGDEVEICASASDVTFATRSDAGRQDVDS